MKNSNVTKDFLQKEVVQGLKRPGLLHTRYYEEMPTFEKAESEFVYPDINYSNSSDPLGGDEKLNCQIVFGRDRDSHLLSGYGKIGGSPCASIDIVAGRMSSENKQKKGLFRKDLEPPTRDKLVGNNFFSDASRIYISQKADIDHYFGLPPGRFGRPKGEAAIGIKSDHVRIIGRDSVKIFAGSARAQNLGWTGELNSNGEMLVGSKIEFITNLSDDPEPLVKGNKLIICLNDIVDKLQAISEAFVRQNTEIIKLSSAVAKHFHIGGGVGYITVGPDPILITESIGVIANEVREISTQLTETINTEIFRQNYLGLGEKSGLTGKTGVERLDEGQIKFDTYVLSTNVFST
tara:strand:- start:3295 stop:4341 length:1047 start_codon:yes stop_codon:yes gene_type:complete